MANAQPNPAVEYLRQNKDKFPLDVLRQKLAAAGYPKEVVERAFLEVFQLGGQSPVGAKAPLPGVTGFFDFKNVKSYNTFGEKMVDFLVGWLGASLVYLVYWIVGRFLILRGLLYPIFDFLFFGFRLGHYGHALYGHALDVILALAVFAVHIFGIFYFWKRRHYLARGLLFAILLPIALGIYYGV